MGLDTSERVRRYLRAIGPAVAGSGRSHATVLSACLAGHDFGLDLGAFYPLLDEWNGANQPPLDDRALRTQVESAYRSAKSPFGHKLDAADARDDGPPMPPPAPPEYPPVDEVARLWAQCRGVDEHPGVAAWLASRGLDPARLSQPREVPMCRALQQYAQAGHPTLSPGQRLWMPRWAAIGSDDRKLTPWTDTGYQVLIPCYDAAGVMRSFRARWIHLGDPPAAKAIPPRGFEARGLVMANIAGLWLLREGSWPAELAEHHRQLWLVEGEPDTLTFDDAVKQTRSCHRAVWGVYNGSWTAELAARVPDNADVVLGIHDDEAGRKYRDKVDRTLHGRVRLRVHVPKKPREA